MELRDKVCVVTGGAGGIGSATAKRFASEGARGVVVADLDGPGTERVAEEVRALGAKAIGVGADIGTEAGNIALIDAAEKAFGPIDIFFANAGVGTGGGPEQPDSKWDLQWRVNTMAHVWASRALLPGWLARGEGYLVTTASMAGILTSLGDAAYAASKHAAVGFAEWMSITYGDRGIRVSCLCPGLVDTAMGRGPLGDARKSAAAIGGGEVATPEHVADVVVRGIREERFLLLTHEVMATYMERHVSDTERWLVGMRRLWKSNQAIMGQ